METRLLDSTQRRFYPADVIPLWCITGQDSIEAIQARFEFEEVELRDPDDPGSPALTFKRGKTTEDKPAGAFQYLAIDNDRVEMSVYGTSKVLDGLFQDFSGLYDQIAGNEAPSLLKSSNLTLHDTIWIGRLDIEPFAVFHNNVRSMLERLKEVCQDERLQSTLYLDDLRVAIASQWRSPELAFEMRGDAPHRQFRLEPRGGTSLGERVWFSSSPLRSEIHLGLLNELEEAYRQAD
jgi:hypothetical protein